MKKIKTVTALLLSIIFYLCFSVSVYSLDRFSAQRIRYVFKEAEKFDEKIADNTVFYSVKNREGALLGYAFFCEEEGYGGAVKSLVCLDENKKIKKVLVYDAKNETPEIGGKCLNQDWLDQFIGHDCDNVPYNKYEYEDYGIDGITGATITSTAVLGCIIRSVETEIGGE